MTIAMKILNILGPVWNRTQNLHVYNRTFAPRRSLYLLFYTVKFIIAYSTSNQVGRGAVEQRLTVNPMCLGSMLFSCMDYVLEKHRAALYFAVLETECPYTRFPLCRQRDAVKNA